MKDKSEVIAELQRVAKLIGLKSVSRRDFQKHGEFADTTVARVFASWNRAIVAAGLEPYTNTKQKKNKRAADDADLQEEIIRLTIELGKRPSESEMSGLGKFSTRPYVKRWGTFARGREHAYETLGLPDILKEKQHG
jgi:hypothetical protein